MAPRGGLLRTSGTTIIGLDSPGIAGPREVRSRTGLVLYIGRWFWITHPVIPALTGRRRLRNFSPSLPIAWTISNSERDGSNSETAQVVKGMILDSRLVRMAVVSSSEKAPARLRDSSYSADARWLLSAVELGTEVTLFL